MDIKLKNNKKKFNLIILGLIIILSLGIIGSYPFIKKSTDVDIETAIEENRLFQGFNGSNYVLYQRLMEDIAGKEVPFTNTFLTLEDKSLRKEYVDEYGMDSEVITDESIIREFENNEYISWENNLDSSYKNLLYYIKTSDNNKSLTNTDVNLKELGKNKELLKNKYLIYVEATYDKFGAVSINENYGININTALSMFSSFEDYGNYGKYGDMYSFEPIKDTTIVYAVPKELKYQDNIYHSLNNMDLWRYYHFSGRVINLFALLTIMIILIIPLREEENIIGLDKIKKLPLEINLYFLLVCGTNSLYMTKELIVESVKGNLTNFIDKIVMISPLSIILTLLINLAFWMIFFAILIIEVIYIKSIIADDYKAIIKEKSILYKLFIKINIEWGKFYASIKNIDLRKPYNKKLRLLIIINGIIVSIIACTWFFGIPIVIIYSLILYSKISKYIEGIKKNYELLQEATNKMANGNLNVEIKEDLGVFDPIKDELEKIQSGFRKAVDKEVKSQKMKTELISNVSHDLKTPLTSIITYVDLLKDENIKSEDREKYIDTIDRKAQRLKVLIEDLFEVSKANSGDVKLNIMNVDVVSLIKQTEFELQDKIQEANLQVKYNLDNEKVVIPLDSQRTFRVFENLILNAVKYAMPNSRVYIDLNSNDDDIEILIKNMSATEMNFTGEEIIERFTRGDKSRNTEGSGLGLAIAKSFVELQGGNLKVDVDGDLFKVTILFKKVK